MKRYRKRPVIIEAVQWEPGQNDWVLQEIGVIINSADQEVKVKLSDRQWHRIPTGCGLMSTLEGDHIVAPGDWIIKGIKGEYYPCKPDIFEATYEAAP